MRAAGILIVGAALLAACKTTRPTAPDIDGAPPGILDSELVKEGNRVPERAVSRCLFVYNHTDHTATVFVGGRHAGYVGPHSTVGLPVGHRAGLTTYLRASCSAGTWSDKVQGTLWDYAWHLR